MRPSSPATPASGLCLLLVCLPSVLGLSGTAYAPVSAWIGGHFCTVFNGTAPHVLVLFHGYLNEVQDYYPLAARLSELGYATVVPQDCNGADALACAANWGKEVAASVRDWAGPRPVGIVGHSMGGGAAMSAAKFTTGLAAFVAMHPAPIVSGVSWAKVRGPILFVTGTYDDGTFGGNRFGATSPDRSLTSYNEADMPKALVNVKGNVHMSSITASGDEWLVVTNWLDCFVRQDHRSCEWVRTQMCTSPNLQWCYHFGVQQGERDMVALHV